MDLNGGTIKVVSFAQGYHAYMHRWEPEIGEERQLRREPSSIEDINAVAVVREKTGYGKTDSTEHESEAHPNQVTNNDEVLGHVPRLMARVVTK